MLTVFEGSEKKCELIMAKGTMNLRSLEREFWVGMVDACAATILSSIHNDTCDAYLLSESSLFVWDDHFLLITCGQTKLVESIVYFLEHMDASMVAQILFQRKNEMMSAMQPSTFEQDVAKLQALVPGVEVSFGKRSSHFTELFHLERNYRPEPNDRTYELLMYGISEASTQFFTQGGLTREMIRSKLRLSEYLDGWELDDFVFEPCGYSLNALKGTHYLTIHMTPESGFSYVSLETNIPLASLIEIPLAVLEPESFDLVMYQPENMSDVEARASKDYSIVQQQTKTIDCGYTVHFQHWQQGAAL